jgi:hypothetical protein
MAGDDDANKVGLARSVSTVFWANRTCRFMAHGTHKSARSDDVCSYRETGSDRRAVKVARLTRSGRWGLGIPEIRAPVCSDAFLTMMHGKG